MPKNEVRIYEDPYTREIFEGWAKVLIVYSENEEIANCRVRFLAGPDPRTCDRLVDVEQLRTLRTRS